ncbi:MAG: hypothetical protein JST87_19255 [Bacteroidetes bacterium]|nr:hypothetical protein [Bacteroidota bacterium]
MITYKHSCYIFLLLFFSSFVHAQNLENPGDYMTAITNARGDMDSKYMQYVSAAAHGRRARKVEKLREQVLDNITQSRYKTIDLPKYKGDNSLRQGSIDYIQMCYRVFSEDYKKIINVEELAEQSVDEMQAYLLLQQKVGEKLHEAHAELARITKEFAAKYNVRLVEEQNELGQKMETAAKLNTYIDNVYLSFFKCNWEDQQIVNAMNNRKVNDIEQARNALSKYADEGLKSLDTLKVFDGDPSLANACRQAMQFYKNMADKDIPQLTDYYLKQEEFEKSKKAFESKSSSARTKEDVDNYNKAVKDINNAVNSFNQTNTRVNNNRTQIVNNWQDTEKRFADDHMPHYR